MGPSKPVVLCMHKFQAHDIGFLDHYLGMQKSLDTNTSITNLKICTFDTFIGFHIVDFLLTNYWASPTETLYLQT